MQLDSAKHYLIARGHGEPDEGLAFFPWAPWMLGARWAYEIPDEATRHTLSRFVRVYNIAYLVLLASAVLIGRSFGYAMMTILCASIALNFVAYSALAIARIRNLTRISVHDSLRAYSTHLGEVRLYQGIAMGVFTLILAVVIGMHSPAVFPFAAFFVTNALVTLYVLRLRHPQ